MRKAVLIYSGGLDSTTLLYQLVMSGVEVLALGFDYGQRHSKELRAAQRICDAIGIRYKIVDMHALAGLLPGSSQTDPNVVVPEGHYEEESMKATVVPNRNMIMLSIAAGVALAQGFDCVAYAAHAGDHAIYPDCRPEFVAAVNVALSYCDWKTVELYAPYVKNGDDKARIVAIGSALGVPYSETWTCYKGLEKHCGKCGSCRERKDAFKKAGVADPTEYTEEGML